MYRLCHGSHFLFTDQIGPIHFQYDVILRTICMHLVDIALSPEKGCDDDKKPAAI